MRDKVLGELKKAFRPEFLNRVDEVIVFHSLSAEHIKAIVDLIFRRVKEQLLAQDIMVELTDEAKELLAAEGYDPILGARPLRRAIQKLIEDPLSEALLNHDFKAGDHVLATVEGGKIKLTGASMEKVPSETVPSE